MSVYECMELGFSVGWRREHYLSGTTSIQFHYDKFEYCVGIELKWFERILGNKPGIRLHEGTINEMRGCQIMLNCMEEISEDARIVDLAFRFDKLPQVMFYLIFGDNRSVKLIVKISDDKTSTYRTDEIDI